jgi:hypothetical protein
MSDEKKPTVIQMTDHPWVAVDLDGCLMDDHYYPGFGPPRHGARDAMIYLKSLGLKIMVFTARTHISGLDGKFQNVNRVVDEIREWASGHEIPIDYIWPLPKPGSILCFFDDRAIRVSPPGQDSQGNGDFGWFDAINRFDHAYKEKVKDWLREVTPKSFLVKEEENK